MAFPGPDGLAFLVLTMLHIQCFLVLKIDNVLAIEFEKLPPVGIGTGDTQVIASTI